MGCGCGGGGARAGASLRYKVVTASGETKGPFLTQVEARVALTAAGGGTIVPVRE